MSKSPIENFFDSFLGEVQGQQQQAVTPYSPGTPGAGGPGDPNMGMSGPPPVTYNVNPIYGQPPQQQPQYGSPWAHPGYQPPQQQPSPYQGYSGADYRGAPPPAPGSAGSPAGAPDPYINVASPWQRYEGQTDRYDVQPEPEPAPGYIGAGPPGFVEEPWTLGGEVKQRFGESGAGISGAWEGYLPERAQPIAPEYYERTEAIRERVGAAQTGVTAPLYDMPYSPTRWYQEEVVAPVVSGLALQQTKRTPVINEAVRGLQSLWGGAIPIFELFDTVFSRIPSGFVLSAAEDNPAAAAAMFSAATRANSLSTMYVPSEMFTSLEMPKPYTMADMVEFEKQKKKEGFEYDVNQSLETFGALPLGIQILIEVANPIQFDTGLAFGAENVASMLRRTSMEYAQGIIKPMTKFDVVKQSFWDSWKDLPIIGYTKVTKANVEADMTTAFANAAMTGVHRADGIVDGRAVLRADPVEIVDSYKAMTNDPTVLFGDSRHAPQAMRNLKKINVEELPAIVKANKAGEAVNMPQFNAELSASIDFTVYDSHGLIQNNELVLPFSVRVGNVFRAFENLPWLGTPSYVFNNASSGQLNALTGGIWMYGDFAGTAARANAFPVPDRVMTHVAGVEQQAAVKGLGVSEFARHQGFAEGIVSEVVEKTPVVNWYFDKIHGAARQGLIKGRIPVGEETMYTAQWSRLVADYHNGLWTGSGPTRGTGGFNMVPPPPALLPPDVATLTNKTMRKATTYQGGLDALRADLEGRSVAVSRWLDDDLVHLNEAQIADAQRIVDESMEIADTPEEAMELSRERLQQMQRDVRNRQDIAEANDEAPIIPTDYAGTPASWAEQMAEHVTPDDPGSERRAKEVTEQFSKAVSRLFEAAGENLDTPYLSTTMRQAYMDILDHWHKSYLGGDVRLKGAWNRIDSGVPKSTVWPGYFKDTDNWWGGRFDGLTKIVDDNVEYMRAVGAGEVPMREDYTDTAAYFDDMVAEMEASAAAAPDPEFHRDVVTRRAEKMESRLLAFNEAVAEFDKTKDARYLGWYTAASEEDVRITGKAVAHIAEQRAKMLADQLPLDDYYRIRDKLWRDLAHDTRGVYDDLRISIGLGDQAPSYVDTNKRNLVNQIIEETNRPSTIREAAEVAGVDVTTRAEPDVVKAVDEMIQASDEMRKAAAEAGVGTVTEEGVQFDYHLTNTINKALRETGLAEIPGKNLADNSRNIREMEPQQWNAAMKDLRMRKAANDKGLDWDALNPEPVVVENVEQLSEGYRRAFGVSENEAGDMGRVVEGRARVWAKQTGRSADEYINAHFESLGRGDIDDMGDAMRESVTTKGIPLFQPGSEEAKGFVNFLADGRAVIRGLKASDVSTMVHETAHVFFEDMQRVLAMAKDLRITSSWIEDELLRLNELKASGKLTDMQRGRYFMDAGQEAKTLTLYDADGNYTRAAHEVFASGFEEYLATGKAPNASMANVYKRFKEWLTNIYGNVRDALGIEVSPEMRQVFDRMLSEDADALAVARKQHTPPPAPKVREVTAPPPKVELPTATRGPSGNSNLAWMTPEKKYQFEYELVEHNVLITSHTPEGKANDLYPAELQPRDRNTEAYVSQVQRMSQQFAPEEVAGTTTALDRGMPIIGADNVVESGNGRMMALGLTDDETKAGYRAFIQNQAEQIGIDAKAIDDMENPVLVRRRVSELDDRIAFVNEANDRANMAMTAAETAQQQGRTLTFSDFDVFQMGSARNLDEAIAAPRNKDFAVRFVKRLPGTDQARYSSSKGLTAEGVEAVRNAMFTRVYGTNPALVDNFIMSSQPEMANIGSGIERSLPGMGKIATGIEEGVIAAEYAIADDIAAAAQTMIELRKPDSVFGSVDEYLAQGRLFGEDMPEMQKLLLRMFEDNKRSGKRIGDILSDYTDGVMSSGRTGKLLDTQGKDAIALMSDAIRGPQQSFFQNGMPPMANGYRYTANGQMRDIQRMIDKLGDMKNVGDSPIPADKVDEFMEAIDGTYKKPYVQAKMLSSLMATQVADFNMLNYGIRTTLDNLVGMVFPYHYWYSRSAWNWAQRFMRRPGYLMWWLKSRAFMQAQREDEPGLRARFDNKYQVKLPDGVLPEEFEALAYLPDPIMSMMPFSNFIDGTDWNSVTEANGAFQKFITASRVLGLRPHMGLNFLFNAAMGEPAPGARDMIPHINFAASLLAVGAQAIPGAIPPMMGKAWLQWGGFAINRSLSSAACRAVGIEDLDYADPAAVLAEAQKRGITDTSAVLPYIEAQMLIEDWYHGRQSKEEEAAMFENELVVEAFRAAGFEKGLPGTIGFFGSPIRPMLIQKGEREQVLLQEAMDAAKYDPDTALGSREDYTSIHQAFPEVQTRWAQYGTIPGETKQSAEATYWRMEQGQQRDEINTRYDAEVQTAVEEDPANHERFVTIQSERFDELNAIEDNVPKDPDKPTLWSTAGANPDEVIEIRSNQMLSELYATRPQWDDFEDGEKWGEAMDEWYDSLSSIAADHEIIQTAAADLGDRGPAILDGLTTRESMDLWSRRRHDPFQALHGTIWDAYKEPYRLRREEAERRFPGIAKKDEAFKAEAKVRYGDDIFDKARGYYSEIFGRYGQDIFEIQGAYFDQLEKEFGPDMQAISSGYSLSGPKGSDARRAYLLQYPGLPQYWDRKTQLLNQTPKLRQYWAGKEEIKVRWGVAQYLDEKQLLEDKHGVSEYRDSLREIAKKYPAIEGGEAASFVDAVLERYPWYPEQGFTREVLLEMYKDVALIPDADAIWIINEAEKRDVDISVVQAEREALEFLKGAPMPRTAGAAPGGYSPYASRGGYSPYSGGGGGGGAQYTYVPKFSPRRRDVIRLR